MSLIEESPFIRCSNSEDVAESFCASCFQTLVAPSVAVLQARETAHRCVDVAHASGQIVGLLREHDSETVIP